MNDHQLHGVIARLVREHRNDWYIACSANLRLQGMDVEVHDLDYVASLETLHYFDGVFEKYVVRSCYYREELPAYTHKMNINGVEVEGFYHDDPCLDLLDEKRAIEWFGLKVPVLPLPHAQLFYEKIGRWERADEIETYLSSQKATIPLPVLEL